MPEPIALRCPSCASAISAADLAVARDFLQCSHCGTALTLGRPSSESSPAQRPRPDVPLPSSLQVDRDGDTVVIHRRWFTPAVLALLVFCIAWDSFLFFWYSMATRTGAPWIAIVFPIGHVAVGVALTYSCLATLLNRTRITASPTGLRVRHGPIPWLGNVDLARNDLAQLYCRRFERHGKRGTTERFEIWLQDRNGRSRKLLGAGLNLDQALAIEQQIERAFRIPDRPVPGEIDR